MFEIPIGKRENRTWGITMFAWLVTWTFQREHTQYFTSPSKVQMKRMFLSCHLRSFRDEIERRENAKWCIISRSAKKCRFSHKDTCQAFWIKGYRPGIFYETVNTIHCFGKKFSKVWMLNESRVQNSLENLCIFLF